ncbi:uncharacterized protein LOC124162686 [Ischnura elegans]|uniref:uncharacterized protein LOC124162686 n=1 Tax=Ischnura elegans TaxID=197161 RepID=UPI001ED8A023|nr:uncharacterized protein LOC124162686 [Ischnura elegans]
MISRSRVFSCIAFIHKHCLRRSWTSRFFLHLPQRKSTEGNNRYSCKMNTSRRIIPAAWLLLVIAHIGAVLTDRHPDTCKVCMPNTNGTHPMTSTNYGANNTVCTTLSFKRNDNAVDYTSGGDAFRVITPIPSCTACTDEAHRFYPSSTGTISDENQCIKVTFVERDVPIDGL